MLPAPIAQADKVTGFASGPQGGGALRTREPLEVVKGKETKGSRV
jgi:hypothetical protein